MADCPPKSLDEALASRGLLANVEDATNVDFASTKITPVIGSISFPQTRWSYFFTSQKEFVIVTDAGSSIGIWPYGVRHEMARQSGREYRASFFINPAGFTAGQSGVFFGFDPSQSVAPDGIIDVGGTLFSIRNGVINAEDGQGGSKSGFTITPPTTAIIPAAGDILDIITRENTDGTGFVRIMRGDQSTTHIIDKLPAGDPVFGIRKGAATGEIEVGKIISLSYANVAQFETTNLTVTTNNVAAYIPELPVSGPKRYGHFRATVDDPFAKLTRKLPPINAGDRPFPIMPMIVHGPGDVTFDNSLAAAFLERYPTVRNGPVAYLDYQTGDDATAVFGDSTKPYKNTMSAVDAVKAVNGGGVIVASGEVPPFDIRDGNYTDGKGQNPVFFMGKVKGKAAWRVPVDNLTAVTWTLVSGGVYKATVASGYPGYTFHAITRSDILNEAGFPSDLFKFADNDIAGLTAAASGFCTKDSANEIYVKMNGLDVNGVKRFLKGYRFNAGGNARNYVVDTPVCIYNMDWDGVHIETGHTIGGGKFTVIYIEGGTSRASADYGYGVSDGGELHVANMLFDSPKKDAVNTNHADGKGLFSVVGCVMTNIGALQRFGIPATGNLQGISFHSGHGMSWANGFRTHFGQAVADTTFAGAPNTSWVGANIVFANSYEDELGTISEMEIGFQFQGKGLAGSDNRRAWLDTNLTIGITIPLKLDAGGKASLFNNNFTTAFIPPGDTLSVQPDIYSPDNPPA
jgi:hypothetical protein